YRDPPVEIVRTFKIAVAGLTALGKSNPETHIAVLRYGNFGLLLIGDRAYGAADVERLRGFASRHGFELPYDPPHPGKPFMSSVEETPATDDRPFFFDTVPLSAVLSGRADLPYGYGILFSALVLALALGIGLAVLPIYAQARRASGRGVPPGTLTSIAIGLGFIATELVLLQRLTLYLGQPSLALAVGIAALLGGAACGSAVSSRIRGGPRLPALLSAVGLLLTLALLPMATDATLAGPLLVRVAVALVAATLVGLPLGSVFPNVVSQVGATDPIRDDQQEYLALARGIVATGEYTRATGTEAFVAEPLRLPGYPLFIAPLCVRGCSMWGITFVQAILVAILVVVVAKYAATLIGRRGGLIAGGLVALNPSFAFFGAHALSDVFGTTLMVGSVAAGAMLIPSRKAGGLFAGLLFAASALTRP